MTSPTEALVRDVVCADVAGLDESVRVHATWTVIDALACMVAAGDTPLGRTIMSTASVAAGSDHRCSIVGGETSSPAMAAWANSSLQNLLDYDDTFAGFAHVGNAVVPAALSMAEAEHASGRQLLDAVIVGFQAAAKIGLAMWPSSEVEHKYGVQTSWKVFGAAAAAGRLMGLDAAGMASAFGLVGTCAPPPMSRLRGSQLPRGWYKNSHGWGCMAGVFWAQLAGAGVQGARRVLDDPGGFWLQAGSDRWNADAVAGPAWDVVHILGAEFKPFPCCRWTHPIVQAILGLVAEHDLSPADVDAVSVEGFRARELAGYPPEDVFDAQFSIPFLVATTLCDRWAGSNLVLRGAVPDAVDTLARRVEVTEIAGGEDRYAESQGRIMPSRVRIRLRNQLVIQAEVDTPSSLVGSSDGDDRSVVGKFVEACDGRMDAGAAGACLEMLLQLPDLDDVSVLMRMLQAPSMQEVR